MRDPGRETPSGGPSRPATRAGFSDRWTPGLAAGLLIAAFLLPEPLALGLAIPATFSWVVLCAGDPVAWARSALGFSAFLLVGCLPIAIDISWYRGSWPRVVVDSEGLRHAGRLAMRSLSAFLALRTLSLVLPTARLVQLPLRAPMPEGLRALFQLCALSALMLTEAAARLARALRARMALRTTANRIRSAGLLAARIVPHALDEAERRERALRGRGWNGGALRTHAIRGEG